MTTTAGKMHMNGTKTVMRYNEPSSPQDTGASHYLVPALLSLAGFLAAASTPDASTAGELQVEPSTLHCLAVRWPILGDDNHNAAIEVHYRKVGEKNWKQGYNLHRTIGSVTADQQRQWGWEMNTLKPDRIPGGRLFAGSIVDLDPDTEYDVKLSLSDPDGGDTVKSIQMRTIAEPQAPAGMRERHVIPGDGGGTGSKEDPFRGLASAMDAAEAGDLFLLHAGTYIKGQVKLKKSGQPGKPIIFRGAMDGETILDGGGDQSTKGPMLSGIECQHIWLEDMTLQGRYHLIVAHEGGHWVIRRCVFRKMTAGFTAHNGGYAKSQGHFISDNVFTGPTEWPRTKGIEAFTAICMSGAGHVVCFNRFEHLGDGLHGTQYGHMSASDFHNNEVSVATDDGMETDYGETNIRVYRNRIINVAHGITAQPSQGGPIYIYRNFIYNSLFTPFKLHNDTSGVLVFHNTSVRDGDPCRIVPPDESVTDVHFRNNLFIGTKGTALLTTAKFIKCDFDSDGFGGYNGPFASWNKATWSKMQDAKKAGLIYSAAGAFAIDPASCFGSGLVAPNDTGVIYPLTLDHRLGNKSDAIDKGVVLLNFNDGYSGKAPDLGAIEFGDALPEFGPRSKNAGVKR